MRKGNYAGEEFQASLRGFAGRRTDLVKTLAALSLGGWSPGACFTGTKPGWTPTVFDLARAVAAHEQSHYAQISETAAALRCPIQRRSFVALTFTRCDAP